ncbi:MAG TPA: NlpC/P60 family protein [Nocardioidaceae bacterium]|nr:NlpC/P60 family protein [Nocardioidaceae bacterium]
MPANRYAPKHRAVKNRVSRDWKRLTALGATVPAAFAAAVSLGAPAQAASQEKIHDALEVARDQKGDPYEYGADGPHAFDCSGLIQYSYGKADINMPRTTDDQAQRVRRIARTDMRKGDLMFYTDGGDVYHVGVFGGWNGEKRRLVIHAPNEGENVKTDLNWSGEWFAGTMRGA